MTRGQRRGKFHKYSCEGDRTGREWILVGEDTSIQHLSSDYLSLKAANAYRCSFTATAKVLVSEDQGKCLQTYQASTGKHQFPRDISKNFISFTGVTGLKYFFGFEPLTDNQSRQFYLFTTVDVCCHSSILGRRQRKDFHS